MSENKNENMYFIFSGSKNGYIIKVVFIDELPKVKTFF